MYQVKGAYLAQELDIEQALSVGESDLSENPGDNWHLAVSALELALSLRDSEWRGDATLEGALAQLELTKNADEFSYEALNELIDLALDA